MVLSSTIRSFEAVATGRRDREVGIWVGDVSGCGRSVCGTSAMGNMVASERSRGMGGSNWLVELAILNRGD
jgi:hypothetical protein